MEPFTRTGAASQGIPLGATAQQHHLPQASTCLLLRARFAWHSQHPFKSSGLGKALFSHPCPGPTTRICFSQLKRGASHPTSAKEHFLYICVPLNQHHLLMVWGQLKFSGCAAEGFSTEAGVLTMVAWHSSSSAPAAGAAHPALFEQLPFSPARRAQLLGSLHNNYHLSAEICPLKDRCLQVVSLWSLQYFLSHKKLS